MLPTSQLIQSCSTVKLMSLGDKIRGLWKRGWRSPQLATSAPFLYVLRLNTNHNFQFNTKSFSAIISKTMYLHLQYEFIYRFLLFFFK